MHWQNYHQQSVAQKVLFVMAPYEDFAVTPSNGYWVMIFPLKNVCWEASEFRWSEFFLYVLKMTDQLASYLFLNKSVPKGPFLQ